MGNALRRRFWFETSIAIATSILLVITLVWKDWIEIVFRVDPDSHSGVLEWLIVGALLLVTIMCATLATYEWRKG